MNNETPTNIVAHLRGLMHVFISFFVFLRFSLSLVFMCVFVSFPPFAKERNDNIKSVRSRTWILVAIYDIILNTFTVVKIRGTVTKKKRVRKHPAHWLASTNPGIHIFLIYSTQIRRLDTSSKLNSYWCSWTLQDRKHTNTLLPRDNNTDSTIYISCLSNSYRCQHGRLPHCIYRLCTTYESTNSTFHQMFTKTQIRDAVYPLIPLQWLDWLLGAAENSIFSQATATPCSSLHRSPLFF